jgi:hypothetical protein
MDRGQVSRRAAGVYDLFFVPALFEQWSKPVAAAADGRPAIECSMSHMAGYSDRRGRSRRRRRLGSERGNARGCRRQTLSVLWCPGAAETLSDRAILKYTQAYANKAE